MGVSINGEAYRVDDVIKQIDTYVVSNGGFREGALSADEFFHTLADDFGIILGEHFALVYNEYYESYNPAYEFTKAVSSYYFPYVDIDENYNESFSLNNGTDFGEGANADEILSAVFEEEFGYEGKFSDRWDEE
jgi:hypothetical protein